MTVKKKETASDVVVTDLAQALARARGARSKLDNATDALNGQLGEAEKAISALKLGVSGRVLIETVGAYKRCLNFGKLNDQWRLTVQLLDFNGNTEEEMPLVNAPRSVRLLAAKQLPTLVTGLVQLMDEEIKQVDEALSLTKKFIESISDHDGPPPSGDDPFDSPSPPADEDAPF